MDERSDRKEHGQKCRGAASHLIDTRSELFRRLLAQFVWPRSTSRLHLHDVITLVGETGVDCEGNSVSWGYATNYMATTARSGASPVSDRRGSRCHPTGAIRDRDGDGILMMLAPITTL
jgi:hypothetical protein